MTFLKRQENEINEKIQQLKKVKDVRHEKSIKKSIVRFYCPSESMN